MSNLAGNERVLDEFDCGDMSRRGRDNGRDRGAIVDAAATIDCTMPTR